MVQTGTDCRLSDGFNGLILEMGPCLTFGGGALNALHALMQAFSGVLAFAESWTCQP